MLARSELRRRWRSVVVLTLLVGFSGAVVLALVAGARRTESSLARFESASRSADVEFDAGDVTPAQVDELRRVPGVAAVAQLQQLTLISRNGPFQNQFLPTAAQIDRRFGTQVDRARIIEGRAVHLDAVNEITISESLASALHVGVGDDLSFASFSPSDIEQADDAIAAHGPRVRLRIVGIVRRPLDLGGRGATGGVIVPTPAFLDALPDEIGSFSGAVLRVRTEHGSADVDRVTRAARPHLPLAVGSVSPVSTSKVKARRTRSTSPPWGSTWQLRSPPSPRWSASPSRCRARSRSATTTS